MASIPGQLIVSTIVFLLAVVGSLTIGALVLNNVPLGDPPGLMTRLRTYLTTNVAETKPDHAFPELELPRVNMAPALLLTRLELTVEILNWEIVDVDAKSYEIRAVIATSLLNFKDDMHIKLDPTNAGTEIYIRSSSRVGKADFGANTRHIIDLLTMLRQQV